MAIPTLGIIFSVISMVTLGLVVAMAKSPSQKIGVRRFVFWRQALTSFLLFCSLLSFRQDFSFSVGYFVFAIAIAVLSYVALLFAYQALKTGKIGVVAPIANSSSIITVLFSVAFLGESLNIGQFVAVGITVMGIIILSIDFSNTRKSDIFNISSGIPLALIACLIWGIVYALYKIPVTAIGPLLTAFAIELGSFLPAIPANFLTKTPFSLPDKKIMVTILLIGILAATSTLFYNLGISASGGNVALVAAITFSSPIVSSLYGFFVYKEKLTFKQWLGLSLTVLGIICISIA